MAETESAGVFTLTGFLVNRANGINYSSNAIENKDGVVMELYKNTDMRNYGLEAVYHSPVFFRSVPFFTNATVMLGQRKEKDKNIRAFAIWSVWMSR